MPSYVFSLQAPTDSRRRDSTRQGRISQPAAPGLVPTQRGTLSLTPPTRSG
jgi:hypothetical protein